MVDRRRRAQRDERRFLSRIFSEVNPVLIPLYESLLVDHHSIRKGWRLDFMAAEPPWMRSRSP
jgi:hypothetical protein